MSASGFLARFGGTFNRILQFIFSIVCLGIFAYFVSNIRDAGWSPATWIQAVLGISIASSIYALCGIIFTLCLGGNSFFGNLAIILDIAFTALWIYVAWATRAGGNSCSGYVVTPLGSGWESESTGLTIASSLRRACQLNTVVFALAIILCILYPIGALWQFWMVRSSQSRKAPRKSYV